MTDLMNADVSFDPHGETWYRVVAATGFQVEVYDDQTGGIIVAPRHRVRHARPTLGQFGQG